MPPSNVTRACARCRKQKLKCDVQRPCLLCCRAGAECVPGPGRPWINNLAPQFGRVESASVTAHQNTQPRTRRRRPNTRSDKSNIQSTATNTSSSTIRFIEEALSSNGGPSPDRADTSALGYGQAFDDSHAPKSQKFSQPSALNAESRFRRRQRISKPMVSDLVSLLPKRDTALLLVDNYFSKIHWFTLLFHQRHFRQRTHALYPTSNRPILVYEATDESTIGFTSVLLAVFSLSLRYLDPSQQQLLATRGINADQLREHILTTLKLRILDILALGSLEAVQLCVLLNSFYLYHGQPETAWPLCGCGLRLAQALELHRHPSHTRNNFSQQEVEDRKRCWWALHEAETYCSMVYGFPLSFADAKCDAEPLDPRDPWSIGADSQATATNGPTLLEYKCAMSALAAIVRSTLEELYEPCQGQSTQQGRTTQGQLHEKVQALYKGLQEWYTQLPKELQMEQLSSAPPHNSRISAPRLSELPFEQKLFHLQALSLKLAYENAKILTYRPLLSGRIDSSPEVVTTCLNAALQISWAGHVPIFQEAATTYALNSIALHLLTAGIVLCVVASTGPLTANAFQAKLGIHRLLEMQVSLKNNSIMADQGLQILKNLLSRVMQRETAFMLRTDPDHREKTPAEAQGYQSQQSVPVQPTQADKEQRLWDSTGSLQTLATASDATALATGGSLMPNPVEDFSATQIMQDIEEAFRYSDSFMITDENDEPNPYKSSAVSQDQGWIWDAQLGFDTFL